MTKNAYIEKFLKKMAEYKYSSRTISTYRYPLGKFSLFLAANGLPSFQDVTIEILEKYRLELLRKDFTSESIVTYLQAVRKFFTFMENEGYIFSNPAENFKNPRGKSTIKDVPSPKEMEKLLSGINITTSIGIRDRAMIETAYCCALRMNEMLKLTIFNIDFENKALRVFGKGRKERILPLGTQAEKWLKEYVSKVRPQLAKDANIDTLWLSREGNKLIEITYQKMLHSHASQAGLAGKVTGHTMRRACATHMLKNGAHPVAIQHILGHRTLQHLSRYLNLSLNDLQKAHEKSTVGR